MLKSEILENIIKAVIEGKHEIVKVLVKHALENGIPAQDLKIEGLFKGMQEVGNLFNRGEYFVSDVIISAQAMDTGLEILPPSESKTIGKIVVGVVKGNVQDLGKKVFVALLKAAQFKVYDLGVDVPPENFVKKAVEVNADIIGMSTYTTVARDSAVPRVIKELEKRGMRQKIKIMVGGPTITPMYVEKMGIDGHAWNAAKAVEKAKELLIINNKRRDDYHE